MPFSKLDSSDLTAIVLLTRAPRTSNEGALVAK